MPAQPRRSSSRPSRAQRRAGAPTARQYPLPTPTEASVNRPFTARRYYSAEPAPVDYTREFAYVRHDLRRIMILAGILIAIIIGLAFALPALELL